jgi:LmbE family N-acetylglucosaminyl deacetylase
MQKVSKILSGGMLYVMQTDIGEAYIPKKVLVVGAHADDIDFAAGGTVAAWARAGAQVEYVIITDGGKGTKVHDVSKESIAELRQHEQQEAARVLGAGHVHFLGYEDSNLEITTGLKKDLVRLIRQVRPDTVVTLDPTMIYSSQLGMINHSDHRAAGQATLDAVYPLARDHLTYPDLFEEGLKPHKAAHVLLVNFEKQNCFVDISDTYELKLQALAKHMSQFPDMAQIRRIVHRQAAALGKHCGYKLAEGFVRIDITI